MSESRGGGERRRVEGGVEVGGDGRREGWMWEETGGRRGEGGEREERGRGEGGEREERGRGEGGEREGRGRSVLLCESTATSVVASTLVSPHLCSPQVEVNECC